MAAAGDALALEGLTKSYLVALGLRRKRVLRSVDLRLARGATLGLVGPNGCGKSTLLRLLAGVERPSGGRLEVLGGNPDDARVRRALGFLPESSPFPAELSARACLALLGSLQGMKGRTARARGEALLERVGLAEHARVPLGRYSRGMRRRFGLAQAWLHEPQLVLLDEPTAGLDAPGFAVLEDLLAEARGRGATVVLSSHLLGDVRAHCDRLALLLDGRVASSGAPEELLARPGCWSVELAGIERLALDELAAWARAQGGELVEATPSGRGLLDLYRGAGGAASREGEG